MALGWLWRLLSFDDDEDADERDRGPKEESNPKRADSNLKSQAQAQTYTNFEGGGKLIQVVCQTKQSVQIDYMTR